MRQLLNLIAVLAVTSLLIYARRPALVPVFGALELNPLVHTRLAEELNLLGVPTTPDLLVPPDRAAGARWLLAAKALPNGVQVAWRRPELVAAELERSLPPTVFLTVHEDAVTLFCDDPQAAATAAHLCELYLARRVTVLNLRGQRSTPAESEVFSALEEKARWQLEQVLGPNQAAVVITGELGCDEGGLPYPTVLRVQLYLPARLDRIRDKLADLIQSTLPCDPERGDKFWLGHLPTAPNL